MPCVTTWIDLEIIILSKIRQKEKDKYHMISFKFSSVSQSCLTLCDQMDCSPFICVIYNMTQDFPGGPVAKTWHSQCCGPGFSPR